jgi:hypothetical protein
LTQHTSTIERELAQEQQALGKQGWLADTRFVRPDGLDVLGHSSSARDVTELARIAMRKPLIRSLVDEQTETISGGRRLHTWNDLLGSLPAVIGVTIVLAFAVTFMNLVVDILYAYLDPRVRTG